MFQFALILVILIPILAIVLDSQVGRALASRLERGSVGAGVQGDSERLAYLESEIERLSAEVARLDEEGQFVHRLLTEGTERDPASGTGEADA